MQFNARFRILVDERTNAAGLRSRQKMANHATGCKYDGIFCIDIFGGW